MKKIVNFEYSREKGKRGHISSVDKETAKNEDKNVKKN